MSCKGTCFSVLLCKTKSDISESSLVVEKYQQFDSIHYLADFFIPVSTTFKSMSSLSA